MPVVDLLPELDRRTLIHQSTDRPSLATWLAGGSRRIYAGFDPTASSLHVGHLVAILLLRRVAAAGHEPVALIGGATGLIGDPSGRSEERNLLTTEELAANVSAIESQVRRILGECGDRVRVVNNAEWMRPVGYLQFLRDVGKHVPLAQMLAKDSVKSRLERDGGLSYTEFSYMLLQAWDFVHLLDALDCRVQIGGSDQWGNITAGIELGRRLRGVELHGLTCPLLCRADGVKMGKTSNGAIWLDPAHTSPYRFYQYWINLDDVDAGVCLRRISEIPLDELDALDIERGRNPAARESQKKLAENLTQLVHGVDGLSAARQATEIFFGAEITGLDDRLLIDVFADVPSHTFSRASLEGDGLALIEAFVQTHLADSNSKARQTIQQGGAYVNNRRVTDVGFRITSEALDGRTTLVLRSGKKNYALARFGS
ncbi:MAG: tyrosine--tRNA ligase [Planctomycetaceae bacterium]